MGKPTICIGENKGADQLRGNRNFKLLACFCDYTAWFVLDLFFPQGGSFLVDITVYRDLGQRMFAGRTTEPTTTVNGQTNETTL